MTYDEAHRLAGLIDSELRADDERFSRSVRVIGQEGAVFFYENAFVERHEEWYIVFSEHYGFHVFHSEDIDHVAQYKRMGIDNDL